MNTIKRLVLGLISSLLLAVGFVRAADRLDPMLNTTSVSTANPMVAAVDCTVPCDSVDNGL